MSVEETSEELALEGRSVVATVTRFPKGTSDGRVTSLYVEVKPPPSAFPGIDVHPDIVVDMLIYALKLNYDSEKEAGIDESPEHYAGDVARILLSQIKNDDPSQWHEPIVGRLH